MRVKRRKRIYLPIAIDCRPRAIDDMQLQLIVCNLEVLDCGYYVDDGDGELARQPLHRFLVDAKLKV